MIDNHRHGEFYQPNLQDLCTIQNTQTKTNYNSIVKFKNCVMLWKFRPLIINHLVPWEIYTILQQFYFSTIHFLHDHLHFCFLNNYYLCNWLLSIIMKMTILTSILSTLSWPENDLDQSITIYFVANIQHDTRDVLLFILIENNFD